MNITVSKNYILKWCLISAPHYNWTTCGKLINTQTGREIRKVICGRSIGYCINGKFKSLNTLRKSLELIPKELCPF